MLAVDGKAWNNLSSEYQVLPGEHAFDLQWSTGSERYVKYTIVSKEPQRMATLPGRRYRPSGRLRNWDFKAGTASPMFFMEEVPAPASVPSK